MSGLFIMAAPETNKADMGSATIAIEKRFRIIEIHGNTCFRQTVNRPAGIEATNPRHNRPFNPSTLEMFKMI